MREMRDRRVEREGGYSEEEKKRERKRGKKHEAETRQPPFNGDVYIRWGEWVG